MSITETTQMGPHAPPMLLHPIQTSKRWFHNVRSWIDDHVDLDLDNMAIRRIAQTRGLGKALARNEPLSQPWKPYATQKQLEAYVHRLHNGSLHQEALRANTARANRDDIYFGAEDSQGVTHIVWTSPSDLVETITRIHGEQEEYELLH